ncbi:MAG: radical SAM protein, partial [Selenomonadaceae bacterium]|nr:radical SAM protein [Selenomonadaceae bacterium]
MEVLMSGNVDVLSMMHLMATGADLDLSQVQNYEFQKKWKEAGDQAWRKATASNAPVEPSSFNYRVTAKEAILLYNTLYNAMAWVSPKEYRALCGQEKASPRQRKEFLEMGFVVPKDMDERENYGKWRKFLQQNRNYLSLNITTTLKCNAKCPYCYENGVKPVDFDESKLDALIEFIKKEEKGIPIKLNWFGGEPLLNPGLIDEVTRRVGECGFRFESYIVTNGSLITKKMLRKFKRWNVRSIQITLDGTEET